MAYAHHSNLQCQGEYGTYKVWGLHPSEIYMLLWKLCAWIITPQSYTWRKKISHILIFFVLYLFAVSAFPFLPTLQYILLLPLVPVAVWYAHHIELVFPTHHSVDSRNGHSESFNFRNHIAYDCSVQSRTCIMLACVHLASCGLRKREAFDCPALFTLCMVTW